ncbi:MAG: hypothetical protein KAS13_01190 [Candidatus Omnitrophica bacterium]|nr:hypothetical protein [Candidatus Omnitrophota bacterium]
MTTVFHKTTIPREKLKDIIKKNPLSLMEGLSFIDEQMAADEQGIIDFLGLDKEGRLVLVDFDASLNDEMFITALSQMHWLEQNNGLIKRLFFSENADFSLKPYLLLVSSGFSGKLVTAAKQMKSHDIKLVEFKYITAQEKEAIVFEEVFTSKNLSTVISSSLAQEKISLQEENILQEEIPLETSFKDAQVSVTIPKLIFEDVSLSQEEIAEFMEFDKTLEENKAAS